MWVVEGPFDVRPPPKTKDSESALPAPTKMKLLRPNKTYVLGRKGKDLNIPQNMITSKGDHATISVGPYSAEDAENEGFIPKLTYTQEYSKDAGVNRTGEEYVLVNTKGKVDIRDGDAVHPTGGPLNIRFKWIPVHILCTFSKLSGSSRTELKTACLALGIRTTKTWSERITHVMAPSVSPPYDWGILVSLVTASQLVTPAWAQEFVRKGSLKRSLDDDATDLNLEDAFEWVDEAQFRPANASLQAWNPDDSRKRILEGLKFLAIGQDIAPQSLRDLIGLGGGDYESFVLPDGSETVEEWERKLGNKLKKSSGVAKRGMRCSLVLIGDMDSLSAGLGAAWREIYVRGMERLGLKIIGRQELGDALLKKDLSLIDCLVGSDPSRPGSNASLLRGNGSSGTSMPDPAVNSQPDEPSQVQPSSSKPPAHLPDGAPTTLVRRTTRVAPSKSPPPQLGERETSAPPGGRNPLLKRRAAPTPAPQQTTRQLSAEPGPAPVGVLPRRALLKRRANVTETNPETNVAIKQSETQATELVEPPHKRFKALFEGTQPLLETLPEESNPASNSGPSTMAQARQGNEVTMDETTSQSSLHPNGKRHTTADTTQQRSSAPTWASSSHAPSQPSQLELLPFETQQRQQSGSVYQPTQSTSTQSQPVVKQRVKVEPKSPVKRATGGGEVVGDQKEPDREPQFLQALNSRTKGKRKEDDFDRQFNNLRIAVPSTDLDEEARIKAEHELAVWNDFEKDPNVKGNFMVVQYVDLLRKDGNSRRKANLGNDNHSGVPNFKKFKKKVLPISRAPKVDVHLSAPIDYGMGDGYWQNDEANKTLGGEDIKLGVASQSQATIPFPRTSKPKAKAQPRRRLAAMVDSDDSDEPALPKSKGKGKAAVGSQDLTAKGLAKRTFADRIPDFDALDEESEVEGAIEVAMEEEASEIFDMNVSVSVDEPPDVLSNSTLKSTATQNRNNSKRAKMQAVPSINSSTSQLLTRSGRTPSVEPSSTTQKSTRGSAVKRKVPVILEVDSDDSDTAMFKARKRARGR